MSENITQEQTTESIQPQATEQADNKPTLEELIAKDPIKAATEIKSLRKEAETNRIKAKELDTMLSEQAQAKAEAEKKKLEEEGNYKAILAQKESELAELMEFKNKYLEIETGLKNTLTEKISKIEKPELKQLIETSTIPIQERISLADSFLVSIQTPKPVERGQSVATSQKPSEANRLYNPNR